jgi:hypothetical protein
LLCAALACIIFALSGFCVKLTHGACLGVAMLKRIGTMSALFGYTQTHQNTTNFPRKAACPSSSCASSAAARRSR